MGRIGADQLRRRHRQGLPGRLEPDAVRTAVINKRAGGMGLISGRKAFQHPMPEGVRLLNVIQDVYLDKQITIA
jgi:DhnA family fructose-bisphosphate aldolase class Ia